MIVYRIQDAQGRGPFRPGFSEKWVRYRSDQKKLHPWLIEFPEIIDIIARGNHAGKYHGCGCLTIKQLKRWFSKKEYKSLKQYNYQAYCIEIDEILAQSDIQCVFLRNLPLYKDITPIKLY